jgi:soluble lytic murein transglycosylase-like protein
MKKLKFLLKAAAFLCFIFGAANNMAEAAAVESVIYNSVAARNDDLAQAEWITDAILYAAQEYGLDPLLLAAVMQTESGFRLDAVSPAGAIGLMQLMPDTAAAVGVDIYDALGNVEGGALHLKTLIDSFSGWGEYGITDAVAAYNAGAAAVMSYGGVPPYDETRSYCIKVADAYRHMINLAEEG